MPVGASLASWQLAAPKGSVGASRGERFAHCELGGCRLLSPQGFHVTGFCLPAEPMLETIEKCASEAGFQPGRKGATAAIVPWPLCNASLICALLESITKAGVRLAGLTQSLSKAACKAPVCSLCLDLGFLEPAPEGEWHQ